MKKFWKYWKRNYGHLPKPANEDIRNMKKRGKSDKVIAETLAQENMTPEGFV